MLLARREPLAVLQQPAPATMGQWTTPCQRGYSRRQQREHVPRAAQPPERLGEISRRGTAHENPPAEGNLIERWAGDRRERGQSAAEAPVRRELPPRDRSPVVPDEVHRRLGRRGGDNRCQVIAETLEVVCARAAGCARAPSAPNVVGDDAEVG